MLYLHGSGRKTRVKEGESYITAAKRLVAFCALKRYISNWSALIDEALDDGQNVRIDMIEADKRICFMNIYLEKEQK